MKKITLSALGFALSTFAFAQTASVAELGISNPTFISHEAASRAACDQSGDAGSFENGKSFTQSLARIVAHDLTVAVDESFVLETMSLQAFIGGTGTGVNAAFVDVYVYQNNAGAPGALITSELGVIPTSQTVIGNNFGFEAWELVIDMADVTLPGDNAVPKTYWVGISLLATDATNTFWENSSAGAVGFGEAYNDGLGGGFAIDSALEGVYTFSGQCNTLGVSENNLDLVSVYPNPTTDILNVKIPAGMTINSSSLMNVLGANTGLKLENGSMNISVLNSGIYFLKVNTSAGSMTKKIVKQ